MIIRLASNKATSSINIKNCFDLTISKRTILHCLNFSRLLIYKKIKAKSQLTGKHKEIRWKLAVEYLDQLEKWNTVALQMKKV